MYHPTAYILGIQVRVCVWCVDGYPLGFLFYSSFFRFPLPQTGTYWYHAHSTGQLPDGFYGALIIYDLVSQLWSSFIHLFTLP